MADHAAPLEILARIEAGGVDEGDDREIERIAERDEPGRLLRCRDVERSREDHRLVGEDPDRSTVDRRERRHGICRPSIPDLEHRVLVGDGRRHLADVIASGRRLGDLRSGFRTRTIARIVGRPAGGFGIDAVGQVSEEIDGCLGGRRSIGDDERRNAGVSSMRGRSAEFVGGHGDSGEFLDHHRPVDERRRTLGHDREVGDAQEERRPRHCRSVDDDDRRDHPGAGGESARHAPPPTQRSHALLDVGSARRDDHDDRKPLVECCGDAGRELESGCFVETSRVVAVLELDPDDRSVRNAAVVVDEVSKLGLGEPGDETVQTEVVDGGFEVGHRASPYCTGWRARLSRGAVRGGGPSPGGRPVVALLVRRSRGSRCRVRRGSERSVSVDGGGPTRRRAGGVRGR